MTRKFGDTGVPLFGRSLAASSAFARGTVTRFNQAANGVRLYDVLAENSVDIFPACEVLQAGGTDSAPLLGRRVLVAVMPDGSGVIVGALPMGNPSAVGQSVSSSANNAPPDKLGAGDREIVHAGSTIVMTEDGDIVLRPKRALKIQAPSVARIEVGGDASDSPVAGKAFLSWASQVDATLAAHEVDLTAYFVAFQAHQAATAATVLTAPLVAPPARVVTALPVNTGDGMVTNGIKMPSGSDQGGA